MNTKLKFLIELFKDNIESYDLSLKRSEKTYQDKLYEYLKGILRGIIRSF